MKGYSYYKPVIIAVLAISIQLVSCGGGGSSTPSLVTPSGTSIGPAGGTVQSTDNNARINIPANALAQPVTITVTPVADPSGGDGFSVYEFGPDGTRFDRAATITIGYDENALPAGVAEVDLQLATYVNGAWTPLAGSSVDTASNTVSGEANHFSIFGLTWFPVTSSNIWPNDPWQLIAPDAEDADFFGSSVDISGNHAIVGAPYEVAKNTNINGQILDAYGAGAAYIYERLSDGTWDGGTKLVNPEMRYTSENFGNAVAIDGNTALVAAYQSPGTGNNAYNNIGNGAVYVFERQGYGNWQYTAKLTAPDAKADTRFGFSIDLKDDRAIVGIRGYVNVGDHTQSAAYVFTRTGGQWGAPARLTGQDGTYWDLFSWSVGIDGDYAVVGAPYARGGPDYDLDHAGVVYVFHYDGNTWDNGTKLKVFDASEADDLGRAVAISGRWIIAGAPYKTSVGADGPWPGAVYMFYKPPDGPWSQGKHIFPNVLRLTTGEPQSDAGFGQAVDIDDDYAVVGAPSQCLDLLDCSSAQKAIGAAFVLELANGTWSHVAEKLTMSSPTDNNKFAVSVAISGEKLISGNPKYHDSTGETGSAYIFEKGRSFHGSVLK